MSIQEIGIPIDLSKGSFTNTIYKDAKLQLVQQGVDGDGRPVYMDNGYWESDNIVINDKIQAFKNVVKTISVVGGAIYKIYTKTSDDGFTWGTYAETASDGTVNSLPAKYAKIKIELLAERQDSNFFIDKFDVADRYVNELVNSESGVLELKKTYNFDMQKTSQDADGVMFLQPIAKTKFKKIDSLESNG